MPLTSDRFNDIKNWPIAITVGRMHAIPREDRAHLGRRAAISGKAIALGFSREGADAILVAEAAADVKQVAQECEASGVKALPIAADVSNHDEVERVVQESLRAAGQGGCAHHISYPSLTSAKIEKGWKSNSKISADVQGRRPFHHLKT